jgi:biopolymer transport protein ExbD
MTILRPATQLRLRFHMRTTLLLLVLFTGSVVTSAHEQATIVIHLTSHQTCQIVAEEVPCADVGAKLRAMHAKRDSDIHVIAGPTSSYQLVSATLTSLKDAGYRLKVGYIASGSS